VYAQCDAVPEADVQQGADRRWIREPAGAAVIEEQPGHRRFHIQVVNAGLTDLNRRQA
jgi:hypothetical protein